MVGHGREKEITGKLLSYDCKMRVVNYNREYNSRYVYSLYYIVYIV